MCLIPSTGSLTNMAIVKDNASSRLKEIRSEIISKNIQASKRLNAILKQAQADGIVDSDTSVSVRNGRGVIPVSAYDKRRIKGLDPRPVGFRKNRIYRT